MQAQRRGGHAPLDTFQADAQITGQDDVGGTAVHAAIERANSDRAQTGQLVRDLLEKGRALAVFVKAANVKACAKHRLGLAAGVGGEHQHPHAGVVFYRLKVFEQQLQVAVFEFVALGGAVEGDGGHAACNVQQRCAGLEEGVEHEGVQQKKKGVRRRLLTDQSGTELKICP